MKTTCPLCGVLAESKVIDSRPARGGSSVRRRRVCYACGGRFTTYEGTSVPPPPATLDAMREEFAGAVFVMRRMVEMYDQATANEGISNEVQRIP